MARVGFRDRDARDVAGAIVAELRAAVALLTRIPVGAVRFEASGAAAFGLVGAIAGLAGAVPLVLLGDLVPVPAAVLALITIAVVSGALHLDGLADTADSLLAFGPGVAERARRDPAIGPGGAVALLGVLGLELACLVTILVEGGAATAAATLLVAGAVSRATVVVLVRRLRARALARGGSGARFATGLTMMAGLVATVTAAVVVIGVSVLVAAPWLTLAGGVGALGGLVLGAAIDRFRNGLDGDGMGATIELAFASTLLSAAIAAAALS